MFFRKSIVSLLAGSLSIAAAASSAFAQNVPNSGSSAPPSTSYIQYLQSFPLSNTDFQGLTTALYSATTTNTASFNLSHQQMLQYLSNLPNFWDTTAVHQYTLTSCSSPFTTTVTSFLGFTGAVQQWGLGGYTIPKTQASTDPTYAVTNAQPPTVVNLCSTNPTPPFLYPTWYNSTLAPAASGFSVSLRSQISDMSSTSSLATGSVLIYRTGDISQPLVLPYTLAGSAIQGTDYTVTTSLGQSAITPTTVTIPAGQSYLGVTFSPIVNLQDHPEKTIAFSITPPVGVPTNGTVAQATIIALSLPDVTLTGSGPSTIVPGTFDSGFLFTRSGGDVSQPLTLTYQIGGTAVNGTDYSPLSTTVTIPAGTTTITLPISVPTPSGTTAKPAKTVTATLVAASDNSYRIPSNPPPVSFTIPPYTLTVVSIAPASGSSTTLIPGTMTSFTIARSGDTSQPLTIPYTLGGTAQNGTDYQYLPGNVTIPAGQTSASIPLQANQPTGSMAHPQKSLSITIPSGSGYSADPNNAAANYTIPAYTPATVSMPTASGGNTLTPGATTNIPVKLSSPAAQDTTIPYTVSGSAQPGSDYTPLSGAVVIPAGQTTANIPVSVPAQTGSTATPAKTVQIAIQPGNGYAPDSSGNQTFTIPAYTPNTVALSGPNGGALTPGGTGTLTATRSGGDTSRPITIPYTVGGTAQPGTDYSQLPGNITIPAGQTTAAQTFTVPTPTGSTAQPQKTITVTPQNGSGFAADPNGAAAYTIPAYNPAALTVTPTGGTSIAPGQSGGFTVTRPGDTSQPLTIPYTTGGTAQSGTDYQPLSGSVTIPAGQSSATVPINVPAVAPGAAATAGKTLTVQLNPGAGYTPPATPTSFTVGAYNPAGLTIAQPSNGGALTPGGTTDGFTISRGTSGDNSQPLSVNYTPGGSAQPGIDYGQLPGVVTIPAGQSSVTVPIRAFPQSGTTATPAKNLTIALAPGTGYSVDPNQAPTTYTIPAYNPATGATPPAVTVSLPPAGSTTLTPGSTVPAFTVTRSGDVSQPLPVYYSVGGTAQDGADYQPLPGVTTIPAGQNSATVPLNIPAGATPGRTIQIALSPNSGYTAGTNTGTTFTIATPLTTKNTTTTPTVSTVPSVDPFGFTLSRATPDNRQPLTLMYTPIGTAMPGQDYVPLSGVVTIPAGQNTAFVPVKILPTATSGRTLGLQLVPSAAYTAGTGFNDQLALSIPPMTPIATSPTSNSKKGSSSTGAIIGGVAAAGGLTALATTGALGGAATAASSALSGVAGLIPQACSVSSASLDVPPALTRIAQLTHATIDTKDWSAQSFANIPSFQKDGSGKIADQVRTWKAKQPVSQVVRLGDLDGIFNPQCMTFGDLLAKSGVSLRDRSLASLKMLPDTSFASVAKTFYGDVSKVKVADISGLGDMISTVVNQPADKLASMTIADAMKAYPTLAQKDLGTMKTSAIPGFESVMLAQIPNWKELTIDQVPGLSKVQFSQFPGRPAALQPNQK